MGAPGGPGDAASGAAASGRAEAAAGSGVAARRRPGGKVAAPSTGRSQYVSSTHGARLINRVAGPGSWPVRWEPLRGPARERAAKQGAIRSHPRFRGLKSDPNRDKRGGAAIMVTETLLIASGVTTDGKPHVFAIDKGTGRRVGQVETPALIQYAMSGWVHDGNSTS